jgi:hypothetical protein
VLRRRPVSRQTVIILDLIEELRHLRESRRQRELPLGGKVARRTRNLGQYLYPPVRRLGRE